MADVREGAVPGYYLDHAEGVTFHTWERTLVPWFDDGFFPKWEPAHFRVTFPVSTLMVVQRGDVFTRTEIV